MNSYQINLDKVPLTIGLKKDRQDAFEFHIASGHGRINFALDDFEEIVKIFKELESTENFKDKEKHIDFNEFLSFHRNFISDTSKEYNYEFRITEKEKNRNVSHSIDLRGMEQLMLIKDSLIKIYNKYTSDKWLDEKIKSEGIKYVEVDGKNYEVKNGILKLGHLGIKKITDIKGLESIKYLRFLGLLDNEIEQIEGLDHLIHLKTLILARNYIKEVKGLENLRNLERLALSYNPISDYEVFEKFDNLIELNLRETNIPKEIFKEAGIENPDHAQGLIKFLKIKKEKNREYKEIQSKTIEYIKQASSVFEEITYSKIIAKTGIKLQDLEEIVEDLIFSGQVNAKIRKDGIAFIEENPLIDITLDAVDVLRGIKDDTELISQYTSYIEQVFDKIEDIEDYLKSHLASEFEKIRNAWQDYKEGKIDKRELIKIGLKQIGKKFLKIFIQKL